MSRTLLFAAALAALPILARPEAPLAEGTIETGDGRVEVLGRRYAPGDTIELPEGYLRVEEAGPEDEEIGSFTVVPAAVLARAQVQPPAQEEPIPPGEEEQPPPARDRFRERETPRTAGPDCGEERRAYLAEIWKQSGIELSDAEGFLAGLEQTDQSSDLTLAWFALSTDAFRTLAWSSDAREKAMALARCARGR